MLKVLTALIAVTAAACTSPGSARQVKQDSAATQSATSAGAATPVGAASAAASASAVERAHSDSDASVRELQRRADRSRIAGDSAAKVWMVEVSDFQCPFCARFHAESYDVIKKEYVATGRVKLAYVNFPLPMHANAFPAAEAALCAGAQGRFWEMHDALFRTQESWSDRASNTALFDTLAKATGVQLPAFQRCMRGRVMQGLVQQDLDRGTQSGVRSTPTFFIGDTAIRGAQPIAVFRQVLDTALARAARGRSAP